MDRATVLIESLDARQAEYRYLLLDPLKKVAPWNPLHEQQLYQRTGNNALRRVPRPDLAWSPEHCPMLLLLASPGERCDESLVRSSEAYAQGEVLDEKRYVCGWLSSALAPDAMANWIASLCGNIKQNATIPIFEPLRLELLQATAVPDLVSAYLSEISQWHFISCTEECVLLEGCKNDTERRLNWGAELAQSEVRNIWRLLSAWSETAAQMPSDAAYRAVNVWAATEKHGLHHLSDRLCLALNTLTLPVDITRHPIVQALLQQAIRNPEMHFTQMLQALPESAWQDMSHA